MKFSLSANQHALKPDKRPSLTFQGQGKGQAQGQSQPRKDPKTFKQPEKQKDVVYPEDENLKATRDAVALQLEKVAEALQGSQYAIDQLDLVFEKSWNGSFKDKLACRGFLLTLFRSTASPHSEPETVVFNCAALIRYIVLQRKFTGDAALFGNLLVSQLYILNVVLQVLVRDPHAFSFSILKAVDLESDSIALLFCNAYKHARDPGPVTGIADAWCRTDLGRVTRRRLMLSPDRFKLWLLEGKPIEPDLTVWPDPPTTQESQSDSVGYCVSALIPEIEASAARAAQHYLRPNAQFPPPLDVSRVPPQPQPTSHDLDQALSEFYASLEWTDEFYERGESQLAKKYVYEGWTQEFYTNLQAQQTALDAHLDQLS